MSTATRVPPIGPLLPCLGLVRMRIEAYRPEVGAHGSLDWCVYACAECAPGHLARVNVGVTVRPGWHGAGYAHQTVAADRACGDSYDYRSKAGEGWNDLSAGRAS